MAELAESVRRFLEKRGLENAPTIQGLSSNFFDPFIVYGLRVDLAEHGRILCSMKVPRRLLNIGNTLHGGAIASIVDVVGSAAIYTVGAANVGVSVEISVSYLDAAYVDEDLEIEAKTLRVGRSLAVVSVELRKKKTGKIVAVGRHTKYLTVPSKL